MNERVVVGWVRLGGGEDATKTDLRETIYTHSNTGLLELK